VPVWSTDVINVTACRNVVVINGKKAIYEALNTKSVDTADRPECYAESLMNKHAKGYYSIH